MVVVILNLLNIGVLLTANLGVMNLLPLPALDGGRLVSWRARRSEEISWEVLYFIPNRSVAGMLKREAMAPISATRLTA